MPLFYFHLRDAGDLVEDQEGDTFPDLASAYVEAQASARNLVVHLVRAKRVLDGQCIEIVDTAGKIVASVALKSALIQH